MKSFVKTSCFVFWLLPFCIFEIGHMEKLEMGNDQLIYLACFDGKVQPLYLKS